MRTDRSDEKLNFVLNGKSVTIKMQPGETLAELLRERFHLTGTKIGCNEGECGACTVLVDGKPILSCSFPAARVNGKTVLTIEGLAKIIDKAGDDKRIGEKSNQPGWELHPIQDAFVKTGAVQCGFCTPGMIMSAYALLSENQDPSDEDIRQGLKDNLCRCGSYPAVKDAIHAAARAMKNGEAIPYADVPDSMHGNKVIGRLLPRPDAIEKVTGHARFTDDLVFDGMLYGKVKRAGVAHGILRKLDIGRALDLPGVVAVLTASDIPGENKHGVIIKDWPIMVGVDERIRYNGDALAIVAAETREIAQKAVALIDVEVELLDVLDSPRKALTENAPKLHEAGNLLKHIEVGKGDVSEGFDKCDVILEHTFYTQTTDHLFLEPECSIARLTEDGRMEIYVGSQIPYADRAQVAAALGWKETRVRIVGQVMGGGFGGKEDIAGQIHAALLARVTKKPVKILYDRRESLLAHPKRHATEIRVKAGATRDGKILSIETELFGDTGAYASLGEIVMTRATTHSSGPYDIENVKADCLAIYTNNPPAGAFRGFGVLQSAFAIESMMDMLAEKLDIDPIKLRKINALKVGSTTCTGQVLRESVGLMACIEKVQTTLIRIAGEHPFQPMRNRKLPHLVTAWGFAAAYKNTGLGGGAPDKSSAEVEAYPDGTLEVRTSAAELGQGLVTVLQMIVAEEFRISAEKVRVLVMDTDLTPDGGPTTASRQTFVTGNAAKYAARTLKDAMAATLAERFDLPPENIRFVEGLAQVGERTFSLGEVVKIMREEKREAVTRYEYWAPETKPLGAGGDMHFAYGFAAQAVQVEVNRRTGEVKVLRVVSANDAGRVINPLGLKAQIEGGVVMGLGNALTEEYVIDNGIVFTDRMARYRIPTIAQTPEIIPLFVEAPAAEGPYGAKGIGEIVSIPTSPAITNAIYNAVGVRIDRLPVDQEVLLMAIQQNEGHENPERKRI